MKILERIALTLFSIIILIIAVTLSLVFFDVVQLESIYSFLDKLFEDDTIRKIILGVSIVSIILAIKALFFPTRTKKKPEIKTGVLLENKDGRLLISRDTIENLVNSVVKGFSQAVDVQTKVLLDLENNVTVYVTLLVKEDSIIKELSSNMQTKIKETIKRSTDLDVSQVNINIKDIENNKRGNNQAKIKIDNVKINQAKELETTNANSETKEENNHEENNETINV